MDTTYAYLAGVIDSCGYISIVRKVSKTTKKDGSHSIYHEVRMGFGITSSIVVQTVNDVFAGRIASRKPATDSQHERFTWELSSRKCEDVLRKLLPHLRLKRQQAELALELIDLMRSQNRPNQKNNALTDEQIAERDELYGSVAVLNAPRWRRARRESLNILVAAK